MPRTAIQVENLGKQYKLGAVQHNGAAYNYKSLRDSIAQAFSASLRTLRLRRQASMGDRKAAEAFWALKDVSFEVKRGEVLGIIGRNGAGKSTLLKILSQITEPTEGRVQIRGRLASLLEIGTGFHGELTGRENIFLNGAILGMTRVEIQRKFDEIVAFAEVDKFLDTPVKHYSNGMFIRLAFAVAAHLEPDILVVDEVLAVGDVEFQKKCLGKMENVASKSGRTVLFVSHNIAAVETLCSSGLLLDHGKLLASGPIRSVVQEYTNLLRQDQAGGTGMSINLGPALRVVNLVSHPSGVRSGDPWSVDIEIAALEKTVIKEITVLIYSEFGTRVVIFDLRQQGLFDLPVDPGASNNAHFSISVDSLPLVPGDYRVGLHIATKDYWGSYLDLASFGITSKQDHGSVVPYSPQYRGFVDLDFSAKLEYRTSDMLLA
jgi:lipopolysaccharide transport system ATP-binding protein